VRIKRSIAESFGILVLPAIMFALAAYFAGYCVWGTRGVLALEDTVAALGVQQARLAALQLQARVLQHRIHLLEQTNPDDDLVEELARTELMDGELRQVAILRSAQPSASADRDALQ
jgi:cell division protein FtsB